MMGRTGSREDPRPWALNGVGEGLNDLVGALWGPGGWREMSWNRGKDLRCVLSTGYGLFSRMWRRRP